MGIFNDIARSIGNFLSGRVKKHIQQKKIEVKKDKVQLAVSNAQNLKAHDMVYGEAKRRADERYWEDPDKYDAMHHATAQKELFSPDKPPNYNSLRKRIKKPVAPVNSQQPIKGSKKK